MAAPTVTLSYAAATRIFTATVTADPGWRVLMVTLNAPNSTFYSMTQSGTNPSQWTYTWPPFYPPPPGVWTATAQVQPPMETPSGSTSVP
ncbi:MAG TPA: hypothetical protein VFB96_14595 [Pirellulaceae bacterium]|nr:hypothetical protein [Pirellulaceae bacterium]